MPIVQVYMMEGRSVEKRRAVIEKLTDAMQEAIGAPRESIRVCIQELPKENWGIAGKTAKDLGR